jgi:hypothetical protein
VSVVVLQVVLRTRAYGSDISWVVSRRSLVNVVVAPTPTEQNIVMAGEGRLLWQGHHHQQPRRLAQQLLARALLAAGHTAALGGHIA